MYRQSRMAAGGTAPIAGDPARVAGRKGRDQDPEEIESILYPGRRAAERKDERAPKVEGYEQSAHQDLFADDHLG